MILKYGKMLDENGKCVSKEVKIENGIITAIEPTIATTSFDEVIDVAEQLILPGFVDLHVHLREPGGEYKETIATGTLAAAKGGFTTIAAMPNTTPVPDCVENMKALQQRIHDTAHIHVLPYASITTRQVGETLTNFHELKEAGAFAFTDDGVGIQQAGMMYEAMKIASYIDMSIVAHCEDHSLLYGGCVHEGQFAKKERLQGIPAVCESVHIARDVLLAEATGCHYHVCHISTKQSVRVVRDAKRAGIRVTAEVSPHHLLLSEDDIRGQHTHFKMNPPLRSKEDRAALVEGLLDGTIDFIATDHAPHTEEEKSKGMPFAPFGIVGLETAFPLLYTNFVTKGIFTLKQLVDWMTVKPAQAFGLEHKWLTVGSKADLTLVNLTDEMAIDPHTFVSKGRNTPFAGWICKGWPVHTWVNGKAVWKKG